MRHLANAGEIHATLIYPILSFKFMPFLEIIASNSCKNHAIVPQYELNKLTNLSPVIPNMSSKPYFLTRFVLYDINKI